MVGVLLFLKIISIKKSVADVTSATLLSFLLLNGDFF
jgi:hypothetical protein